MQSTFALYKQFAFVQNIFLQALVGLPTEHLNRAIYGIRLILLYLELKFHRLQCFNRGAW